MPQEQLTRAIEYIIDAKYKRYADTIAERLDGEICPWRVPAMTRWEELKTEVRQKRSYARDLIEHFVKKCCSELLRELPPDERDVFWLSDTPNRSERDALARQLYDRVCDLAIKQAEREAWFATTPNELKRPISITSDEIVIPLADFLVKSDLLSYLTRDLGLNSKVMYNSLSEGQSQEDTENAVRDLLDSNSWLLFPEELEEALELPRNERGEYLFERLATNI